MRRRNSGVYGGFDLGIVDSSFPERDLVSTKPTALHIDLLDEPEDGSNFAESVTLLRRACGPSRG